MHNRNLIREGSLPQTETQALGGTTTVTGGENVAIESEILAYEAMRQISSSIHKSATQLNPNLRAIIIYDDSLTDLLETYSNYETKYALLKKSYNDLGIKEQKRGVEEFFNSLGTATIGVKSVIDFLALFRTDTDIQTGRFTPNTEALIFQLASKFRTSSPNITVFYPKLYLLGNSINVDSKEFSRVLSEIRELSNLRTIAEQRIEQEQDPNKVASLKALNTGVTTFLTELGATDTKGIAPVSILAKAANIVNAIKQNGYILYLDVVSVGGNSRVRRNLFTGSRLRYSGGAIVNYVFVGNDGSIKLSNTLSSYSGYVKPEGSYKVIGETEAK